MRKEEIEERIRQALERPRSKFSLVVMIGLLTKNPSRATAVCKEFGLNKEDLRLARWVAVHKREILKKNPEADYSQVIEKIKESKVTDAKMSRGEVLDEESIKQRVEERKKEATDKGILERAKIIACKLGTSRLKYYKDNFKGPDELTRFTGKDLKIEFNDIIDGIVDTQRKYLRIYVLTRSKGKIFKRLVFWYNLYFSEIKAYKPGSWEKVLNFLYQKALLHERKEEEADREARKRALKRNFALNNSQ